MGQLLINNKNTGKFPFISYHCFSLSYTVEGISREITSGQILANCVLRYRNVYLDALQQATLQILLAKFHKTDKDFG
jgi:hypothetical protein